MKAEKPNPSAAADNEKPLSEQIHEAWGEESGFWQISDDDKQDWLSTWERLAIALEAQQTDTLSGLRTQIGAEIDLNKSVLRTDYVIARVAALYWVLSRMTQLDSAQTAKKEGQK